MSIKWFLISVSLFVFLVTVGCTNSEVVKNGWRSLAVSATTYNAVMETSGKLYKDGKLSEEKKALLVHVGKIYTGAYNSAVDALEDYERVVRLEGSATDIASAKTAFKAAAEILKTNLFSLIDSYNVIVEGIDGITKIEKPEAVLNVN